MELTCWRVRSLFEATARLAFHAAHAVVAANFPIPPERGNSSSGGPVMIRAILLSTLLACAIPVGPVQAANRTLKMIPIDLEGDGGTLYVTPEGKSLLIDAGSRTGTSALPVRRGGRFPGFWLEWAFLGSYNVCCQLPVTGDQGGTRERLVAAGGARGGEAGCLLPQYM